MTPAEAKAFVEDVKRKYPNPRNSNDTDLIETHETMYCVGGAFCRMMAPKTGYKALYAFPQGNDIDKAIAILNPNASYAEVSQLSRYLIASNDSNDFDDAWRCLELALCAKEIKR